MRASRTAQVDGTKLATWSLEFVAHDTPERHKIARFSVTTLRDGQPQAAPARGLLFKISSVNTAPTAI
jgi:hypothetical protein